MINFVGTYQVVPSLPKKLEKLRELAYNLYWSWSHQTRSLFRRMDRELWEGLNHNPVLLLGKISQERLEELSKDDGFISQMNHAHDSLQLYLKEQTWFNKNYQSKKKFNIIYFSAEFGLSECLQTYSGGLGILAGDHLKSASDLGLPLIGIGLLYKEGYFQQYLSSDGWQLERYEINDFENLPMKRVTDNKNVPLVLSVNFPGRVVFFQVWKLMVGRVPLYLLDTNLPQNSPSDRKITETLYGGNNETRIQQEIILGIGGIRFLYAIGITPNVCHMNEGHSAFLSLERINKLMELEGLSYKQAKEVGFYSNVFTTHTPVPAGIDVFSHDLIEKYFGDYYRNTLKISGREFFALGDIMKDAESTYFNMAHLAMNTAGFINGVSKLHSVVSKKMWSFGYKDIPFNEIPIGSITNGVHTLTHLSKDMEDLFQQYLGDSFLSNVDNTSLWDRIDSIPSEELWRTHERRRERLVAFARMRLVSQIKARGGNINEIKEAKEVLDPSVLTIGFARRFATYKRGSLIFSDLERLAEILHNPDYPVQLIFAGKAHPKDDEGKNLIQEIFGISNDEKFRRKVVFLENYDMNVARQLVEGCDIWLNTPRRPLEASGTSGMKVIANGGLNFSVLDGWWDEGFSPEVGWKIGNGEEYTDLDYQDEVESRELYNTLEREIIPLFYDRKSDKLPRKWIEMMRKSMKQLGSFFNTSRMVREYCERYYLLASEKRNALSADQWKKAKMIAEWKEHIANQWHQIEIVKIDAPQTNIEVLVRETYTVNAEIKLGDIDPSEVSVQLYYGPVKKQDDPNNNKIEIMKLVSKKNHNSSVYSYTGAIKSFESGLFGFTIRILPEHPLLIQPFEVGKVYWAK